MRQYPETGSEGEPAVEDERFEWDDEKAKANFVKHRICFLDAGLVFDDPGALDNPDNTTDYDEERYRAVGMVNGRLITVFYTLRETRIRIISARKPTRTERIEYATHNPPR